MFSAITYRLAAIAAGAIALILLVFAVFAWMGEGAAKRQNKELRADLVTTNQAWGECKADLATARGEVHAQQEQVRTWKAQAVQVQKAADERVAKARQEAEQYRKRAARLAVAQPQTANRCEAASQLYVDIISEDVK